MKSFILAAVMASTVIAAEADATKDAAKTAVVKRAVNQACDGKLDDMGCADGLRCHTGVLATVKTQKQLDDIKAAETTAKTAAKALDDAHDAVVAANKLALTKWEALDTTKTYKTKLDAYNTAKGTFDTATAKAKTNNALFTLGAKDKAAYDGAVTACAALGNKVAIDGSCYYQARVAYDGTCATTTLAIAGANAFKVVDGGDAEVDVTATATYNCLMSGDNLQYTIDLTSLKYAATAAGNAPVTPKVAADAETAFKKANDDGANRYKAKLADATTVLTDPREWKPVKDATLFEWQTVDPMTLTLPVANPAKPKETTPPKNSKQVAKDLADAAAVAAKAKSDTTETKKDTTATTPATPATATAKVPGPGACGTAEKCDTGEGAAKIHCSAEKLASGILSAIVVVSMM